MPERHGLDPDKPLRPLVQKEAEGVGQHRSLLLRGDTAVVGTVLLEEPQDALSGGAACDLFVASVALGGKSPGDGLACRGEGRVQV